MKYKKTVLYSFMWHVMIFIARRHCNVRPLVSSGCLLCPPDSQSFPNQTTWCMLNYQSS